MTKVINRLGDKMLGMLVRKDKAGACTRCPGPCSNVYLGYTCSNGTRYNLYCSAYYTCDCGCVINGGDCRWVPAGSC
jgi:hypothetical protein